MKEKFTDAEIICAFMEPRPRLPDCYSHLAPSPNGWWALAPTLGGQMAWSQASLMTLDRLHKVEARLTGHHWNRYIEQFATSLEFKSRTYLWSAARRLLHASVDEKILALAIVLRFGVEE